MFVLESNLEFPYELGLSFLGDLVFFFFFRTGASPPAAPPTSLITFIRDHSANRRVA